MKDEQNASGLVLVVDDFPDTLALLHDALIESGFSVLVANNGPSALKICNEAKPDVVLLDAVMPDMDGFEVCKALKAEPETRGIPVIFMTGLTEPEHVVAGFNAGGIDYVTKPLIPVEVIARLNTHMKTSRLMSHTQGAFDAFGQAALALLPGTDRIIWQTALAKKLMQDYFPDGHSYEGSKFSEWIAELDEKQPKQRSSLVIEKNASKLVLTAADIQSDEQWLILLQEESEKAQIEKLRATFNLTKRESEVLHWVIMGKTDKTIAQILGSSPRTVNKHLEHVYIKLGVETRTAAASIAINKLQNVPA
jgi:DNA-binding NarL/FixJ family response regulator